jgi:putative redox protein
MVDWIERELELTGALSAAQLQRLMEIADRCPVHRTLESKVKIHTNL